jgi:molybdopterin converting factor small subunit
VRIGVVTVLALARILGGHERAVDLPGGATLRTLLQHLGRVEGPAFLTAVFTGYENVDLRPEIRILLNGRDLKVPDALDMSMKEGDVIAILQPFGGG